jgi:hypothetical protein
MSWVPWTGFAFSLSFLIKNSQVLSMPFFTAIGLAPEVTACQITAHCQCQNTRPLSLSNNTPLVSGGDTPAKCHFMESQYDRSHPVNCPACRPSSSTSIKRHLHSNFWAAGSSALILANGYRSCTPILPVSTFNALKQKFLCKIIGRRPEVWPILKFIHFKIVISLSICS